MIPAVLLAAALAAAGCAAPPPHVSFAGRPTGAVALPLSGVYKATVNAPLVGPVSARISASPTADGFIANSRPGVAWSMIGGLEGFLGQIFAPHLFPGGVIITWTSQNPGGGQPGEGWIGLGGIRSARARTRITSPGAPVEILAPDGRRVATMTLQPIAADGPPLDDYVALAAGVEEAVGLRLFDRSLVRSGQVRGYLSQLSRSAKSAQDDVEFIFGAVVAGRSNIGFALPLIFRRADLASHMAVSADDDADDGEEVAGSATLRATLDPQTGIATLKVDAFLDAADVDRVFERIVAWEPKGLVIDLNTSPGVTLASLRAASWLLGSPTDAGSFFGPDRRDEALEAGAAALFTRVELASPGSVAAVESAIDAIGAAMVVVMPAARVYQGPVAVLTSRRTSTSAEPLVRVLRDAGRVRVFGSSTAGKPQISRPIPIGTNWVLWLAACDYMTPSGERLERGVRPDVELSKDQAKRAALEWLASQAAGP